MRILFKPVHIKIKIIRWRGACGENRGCNSKVKREYRFHHVPFTFTSRQNGTKLLPEMKSLKDRITGLIKVTV